MAAKRKITIKKKEKVMENDVKIEETPVSIVEENEISDTEILGWTTTQKEEQIFLKKSEVRGTIWWTSVSKPKWRIIFEAQVSPYPMFKLPEDIRRYLQTNWLSTDVWKKDKEWLEKHNVNMEMVEKLKKFLTEH